MLRGLQALAVGALAIVALGGSAAAGLYYPPPGDSRPVWSPDGTVLVYATQRAPRGLHVLRPDGVEEGTLPAIPDWTEFAFSPDWRFIAYTADIAAGQVPVLVVSRPDGSSARTVATGPVADLAWSPDGMRLAFVRRREGGGTSTPEIYTVALDGSGLRRIAENGWDPSFSPDGTRLAYSTGQNVPERWDIAVVPADGGTPRIVTGALQTSVQLQPQWSPQGDRIAFAARGYLGIIAPDGSGLRRYALAAYPSSVAWSPDGRSLVYSGFGIVHLDLATATHVRITKFGAQATLSPDGSTIAFAGGGECKDRIGIYRVPTTGGAPTRLTNDCRIRGTDGRDRLDGTELADVIFGFGGDDILTANDLAYQGDDLYGGTGDDVVNGAFRSDVVDGGPGRDRLFGNANADTLRGGPGRDAFWGGGGKDVLFAEDGEPDAISCGTNRPGNGRDLDVAYLDRRDRLVNDDCELVYRGGRINLTRGPTRLSIAIWTTGQPRAKPRIRTLRCNPAGGTLPNAGAACRRLALIRAPLAPIAIGTQCAPVPQISQRRAQVQGVLGGSGVLAFFNRSSDCEVARWTRHAFLLR